MKAERTFKLLGDKNRLRTLMLLDGRELCVCQIMGVLGVSQPLVSKNLSMLSGAGFLDERKDGKLVFYRVRKQLAGELAPFMKLLRGSLKEDPEIIIDTESLADCMQYQRKSGKCDMKTFLQYMKKKNTRRKTKANA